MNGIVVHWLAFKLKGFTISNDDETLFGNMSPLGEEWMDPNQNRKGGPMNVKVPEVDKLLERDPYLKLHEREIRRRFGLNIY